MVLFSIIRKNPGFGQRRKDLQILVQPDQSIIDLLHHKGVYPRGRIGLDDKGASEIPNPECPAATGNLGASGLGRSRNDKEDHQADEGESSQHISLATWAFFAFRSKGRYLSLSRSDSYFNPMSWSLQPFPKPLLRHHMISDASKDTRDYP